MDAPYTAFAAVYDALMHDVPDDRWAQRLDALLRAALAAPAGAADDALSQHRLAHLGKKGRNINPHRRTSPRSA